MIIFYNLGAWSSGIIGFLKIYYGNRVLLNHMPGVVPIVSFAELVMNRLIKPSLLFLFLSARHKIHTLTNTIYTLRVFL